MTLDFKERVKIFVDSYAQGLFYSDGEMLAYKAKYFSSPDLKEFLSTIPCEDKYGFRLDVRNGKDGDEYYLVDVDTTNDKSELQIKIDKAGVYAGYALGVVLVLSIVLFTLGYVFAAVTSMEWPAILTAGGSCLSVALLPLAIASGFVGGTKK